MTIKQLFDESAFSRVDYDLRVSDYAAYLQSEGFLYYQNKWLLRNDAGTRNLVVEIDVRNSYTVNDELGKDITVPYEYGVKVSITSLLSFEVLYSTYKFFEKGSVVENLKACIKKVLSDDY